MEKYNEDDFIEMPRKPGCCRVLLHKDFFDPKVRAGIEKSASEVAQKLGRKYGFRLRTEEEWAEVRAQEAKEKALHTDAAV